MPEGSKRVAVDSHPRLSGIMDTINSTLAHGPSTRLPKEFYDPKGRDIIDRLGTEEWFSGYQESNEYRILGIGGLLGDVVSRMVDSVERDDGPGYVGGRETNHGAGESSDKGNVRFAMSGCHDTTLAAVLASLGTYEGEKWPPYTSHIAIELFKDAGASADGSAAPKLGLADTTDREQLQGKGLWSKIYTGLFGKSESETVAPTTIARKPLSELDDVAVKRLDGHYVRLRYNDRPMVVPGCRANGKHLDGDESFCTLVGCPHPAVHALCLLTAMCLRRRLSRRLWTNSRQAIGSCYACRISTSLQFPLRASPRDFEDIVSFDGLEHVGGL